MTVPGDVLQVKVTQTLFSQEILNIYYYGVVSWNAGSTLERFATEMEQNILVPLSESQLSTLNYTFIRVDNITNGLEFYEAPLNFLGQRTGLAALPSLVACNVTLVKFNKITRNGAKRLAGYAEEDITGNTWALSQANRDIIEGALARGVDEGVGSPFTTNPVIVKRNPDGTLNPSIFNPVVAAKISNFISSQVSRKQRPT
jgi:hypothetical protein